MVGSNTKAKNELKTNSPVAIALKAIGLAKTQSEPVVLLFPTRDSALEYQTLISSLAETLYPSLQVFLWQSWEHSPFSPISSSITQKVERLRTLGALLKLTPSANAPKVIIASADSWIQPTIPPENLKPHTLSIQVDQDFDSRDALRGRLRELGYTPSELVEEPGQYAFRGEVLDLYSPDLENPIRIDFFDTQVEKIRFFKAESQRTLSTDSIIKHINILPAEEVLFPWSESLPVLEKIKEFCDHSQISRKIRDPIFEMIRAGFLPDHFRTWLPFVYARCGQLKDYLSPEAEIFLIEPEQFEIELNQTVENLRLEEDRYASEHWITPNFDLLYPNASNSFQSIKSNTLIRTAPEGPKQAELLHFDRIERTKLSDQDIQEWLEDGYQVLIGCKGITHLERLKYHLKESSKSSSLKFLRLDPGESLEFLTEKIILLSERNFFAALGKLEKESAKNSITPSRSDTSAFTQISELSPGDYVVHALHGVGKFIELQELKSTPDETGNRENLGEYLLIEYLKGDRLYLPIYRLNVIQRYVGAGASPQLDKLGSSNFEKTKQKARESVKKLAINLIELYAKRATIRGEKLNPPGEDYFNFCNDFEFNETEGQTQSIDETLDDLVQGKLLDRLVCGDVGFGKTEVAMRAAFLAVENGFQVAILVPTTLLAFQHEQSFKKRMRNFPIRIESISRFKNKKTQKALIEEVKSGAVDIIIGTHRLLSKDLSWSNLGLLIVDEEHRFGVEHKEKIKAIQANTHTLTLTATPIPRTLNMALSGLKDISVMKTPPTNRQPIKTFVSEDSEALVKSALEAELGRGGQIFYLHNRVATITKKAEELQSLVPQAKILVAHGKMKEDEIESKMLDFYHGHAQILVCTTIIESGIDVPNAGTILIDRADRLGLAQLYQIRGRVGRSHRKAYAYLLIDSDRGMSPEAKMRLDVLKRFIELGSGFHIASHDLEIRGGGNLLGAEQSGHIASVGLELFTELLDEAIAELRQKEGTSSTSIGSVEDKHFEPEIRLPVVCEIKSSQIADPRIRLTFYRKLSNARNDEQVDLLVEEFTDRFGEPEPTTLNLFWLIKLKNLLKQVGVESLSVSTSKTSMGVRTSTLIDVNEVMKLYSGPKNIRDPRIKLTPDSKIVFSFPFTSIKSHLFELEKLFHKIAPKAFAIEKSVIN